MEDQIEPIPAPGADAPPKEAPDYSPLNHDAGFEKSLSEVFGKPENQSDKDGNPIEQEPPAPPEEKKEIPEEKPEQPEPGSEVIKPPEVEKKKEPSTPPHPDELKPPENVGQRSLEGWGALHKNYKNLFTILKGREDDNRKLKALVAEKEKGTGETTKRLQEEIDQLKGYRAMFDASSDPEFQKQYDAPMTSMRQDMEAILQKVGVSKEAIAALDFSNTELMSAIALQIEQNRGDSITSRRFIAKSDDFIKLHEQREKALRENKDKFKEFQTQKEQQTFAQRAAEQGAISRHIEAVAAVKDKAGKEQFPFLVRKEPPIGAPQAEIAKIDAHNELVDAMHKRLEGVLGVQKPEEKAEVAIAAVAASYYAFQHTQALARIKSLEDELKKVSASGSERRPSGGGKPYKTPESLTLEDSISQAFPGMR